MRGGKTRAAKRSGPRFLVGVDFSPESQAAVREARRLAAAAGSKITIVHVRPLADIRAAVVEERGDLLREDAGTLKERLAAHYEKRLAALTEEGERAILLRGKPALELCREARRGYDVLAMGSRGRGGVLTALLGSTVAEALTTVTVPILVVPSRKARKNAPGA